MLSQVPETLRDSTRRLAWPSPSWPYRLLPQQIASLPVVTPQPKLSPTVTERQERPPATSRGVAVLAPPEPV